MSNDQLQSVNLKIKREITIFSIGIGILLCVVGYFALTKVQDVGSQLWGFDRHLAIGIPILGLGVVLLSAGVFFKLAASNILALLIAFTTTLFSVFYFLFMITMWGRLPINLVSFIFLASPFLVWSRVWKFTHPLTGPDLTLGLDQKFSSNDTSSPRVGSTISESKILDFIADRLSVEPSSFEADTSFREDLRVPPGEIIVILEDLEDRFNLDVTDKKIETIGDIVQFSA